jgi:hypothetical protein
MFRRQQGRSPPKAGVINRFRVDVGSILFLKFRIFLDSGVETGVLRFGPASSEGRFAIVTDVERGMRWTLMATQDERA